MISTHHHPVTMYENMEAGFSFYKCSKRCRGFLTDQEQRKVWGVGILYLLGFPILCCMTVIGALEVRLIHNHIQSIYLFTYKININILDRLIHMENPTPTAPRSPTCRGS